MSLFKSLLASAFRRPATPVLEPRLHLPLDEGLPVPYPHQTLRNT